MDLPLLLDIFLNSFLSWFVLPLQSEIYWFSLHAFHVQPMALPTVVAVLASTLGILASYLAGWLIAIDRKNMPLSEEKYLKASRFIHRRVVWVFIIPWIPFLPLLALVCGFLHCSLWRLVPLVVIGRVIYYSFYLYS